MFLVGKIRGWRKNAPQRALPFNLRFRSASAWQGVDTGKPYTLPLNNEITLTRCIGRYTEIDRKLWATLAALAWDNPERKAFTKQPARHSARLFRELKGGDTGIAYLMVRRNGFYRALSDWEDEDERGTVALRSGLKIKKQSGAIFYQFPDFLIERFLEQQTIFAAAAAFSDRAFRQIQREPLYAAGSSGEPATPRH